MCQFIQLDVNTTPYSLDSPEKKRKFLWKKKRKGKEERAKTGGWKKIVQGESGVGKRNIEEHNGYSWLVYFSPGLMSKYLVSETAVTIVIVVYRCISSIHGDALFSFVALLLVLVLVRLALHLHLHLQTHFFFQRNNGTG